jgi:hypothetical protein
MSREGTNEVACSRGRQKLKPVQISECSNVLWRGTARQSRASFSTRLPLVARHQLRLKTVTGTLVKSGNPSRMIDLVCIR